MSFLDVKTTTENLSLESDIKDAMHVALIKVLICNTCNSQKLLYFKYTTTFLSYSTAVQCLVANCFSNLISNFEKNAI